MINFRKKNSQQYVVSMCHEGNVEETVVISTPLKSVIHFQLSLKTSLSE